MFSVIMKFLKISKIHDKVASLSSSEAQTVCVLQSWFDHYLVWNQTEHPGVKNLRFTTDQIWTPDILLYNR